MLLALSFPKFGSPWLAWVALVPLVEALERQAVEPQAIRRAAVLGWITGLVYFAGTLYWTADVMAMFGGIPYPLAVPIGGILVAYLALYPSLFAATTMVSRRLYGPAGLWLAPIAWVATEWLRGVVLSGFPWALLGYSQAGVAPVAQAASLAGVYLLSALLVFVAVVVVRARADEGRGRWTAVAVGVVVVGTLTAWGARRMASGDLLADGTPLTVALAQGNIAQSMKWEAGHADSILGIYLDQTREAQAQGAALTIWPESSTPFFFEEHAPGRDRIFDAARRLNQWMLFGSDQIEWTQPRRYYNAAFLVTPSGATQAVYRKVRLVPFGEYVPLKRLLFFVAPLVESVADFTPGAGVVPLQMGDHTISTAICYEVVYPHLAREAVLAGSELLTTITNDAWYGSTSAPYQHFEQARLRAIEQGRWLARAANTGISGVVDPYGRVVAQTALFERRVLVERVRLRTGRTIYATIGDSFVHASLVVSGFVWGALLMRRRLANQPS